MIDMLVLRCLIKTERYTTYSPLGVPNVMESREYVDVRSLGIPLECSLDADGAEVGLRHPWEAIPSSASTMAFKLFDFRDSYGKRDEDIDDFFIELKGSPAKLMQGHNVYGTDELWPCAEFMIYLFMDKYPMICPFLDMKSWSVEQVDVTYFSRCKTQNEAIQFINALKNVSNGQTTARGGFDGTVYFGKKNSRIKKIKVYAKHKELVDSHATATKSKRNKQKQAFSQAVDQQLLDWTVGMVRWEASLKTRWFQRRGIDNNLFALNKVFDAQAYWKEATLDIFKALEGKEMRIIRDEEIEKKLKEKFPTVNARTGRITYGQAHSAYRVFRSLKSEGWIETRRTTGKGTFERALEMLHDIGLSKAVLQNLKGDGLKCEVIPFIRYVEINFGEQIPPFARQAA